MFEPLSEPFVLPVARDFEPRGPTSVVDEVALDEIMANGLTRNFSVFVTNTNVTNSVLLADNFALRHRLLVSDIKIVPSSVVTPSGATEIVDFETAPIPERLSYAYIVSHVVNWSTLDAAISTLRMLRHEFSFRLRPKELEAVRRAFVKYNLSTLPLHLVHTWSYRPSQMAVAGGASVIREVTASAAVTNLWKDFVIVRNRTRRTLQLAVGGDFHVSARNDRVHILCPACRDVNSKVRRFARGVEKLWRRGDLDYIALNGDLVDFFSVDGGAPTPDKIRYQASNWSIAQELAFTSSGIPGEKTDRGSLFDVPVLWNTGDHDRRVGSYPLASVEPSPNHFDFYGIPPEMLANLNAVLGFPEGYPFVDHRLRLTSRLCLRWFFECGRRHQTSSFVRLPVDGVELLICFLDTGRMLHPELPLPDGAPSTCEGMSDVDLNATLANVSTGQTPRERSINVVFTHAPPSCLPPSDARLVGPTMQSFPATSSDGMYGVFLNGREQLLSVLAQQAAQHKSTIVISGHVHFRSAYSIQGDGAIACGQPLLTALDQLRNGALSPLDFRAAFPSLLLTCPSIGPRPVSGDTDNTLLLLSFGSAGLLAATWRSVGG